jgi:hypothetical protein
MTYNPQGAAEQARICRDAATPNTPVRRPCDLIRNVLCIRRGNSRPGLMFQGDRREMTKLKLSATLSEEDLRSMRDTAREQGRREGIEEVAVWLEGKMPMWGAASKGMAAEVRALLSLRA